MKKILIAIMLLSSPAWAATNVVTNAFRTVVTDGGTNLYTVSANGATTNLIQTFLPQMLLTNVVKLTNSAVAWDDALSSANSAYRSGVTDISADDALGGQAYAATATTNAGNDHLTFTFQMPHRKKVGTDIRPHIHFWQTNADQTNCWFMIYQWTTLGGTNVADIQMGPATNELAYTAGTMHQLANFPYISGTGKGISSILRIKLYRAGTNGTGSITVTDFDCHYQIDGFGSDAETSKTY